jgi:hypothetical protein
MKSSLKSVIRVKKIQVIQGEQGKIAPNLLQRNFKSSSKPKWATDITNLMSLVKVVFISYY